jgi:hypothetical protein
LFAQHALAAGEGVLVRVAGLLMLAHPRQADRPPGSDLERRRTVRDRYVVTLYDPRRDVRVVAAMTITSPSTPCEAAGPCR